MRIVAMASALFLALSGNAIGAISDSELLDKQIEILQHTFLSIHLDEKCKYLSEDRRSLLIWGSQYVGDMLAKNPLNKLGARGPKYLDIKMEDRAQILPCNLEAKTEVEQSLSNIEKLKTKTDTNKIYGEWERYVKVLTLNIRCHFYDDSATKVLADKAGETKALALKGNPALWKYAGTREKAIMNGIAAAPPAVCSNDSEEFVRMVLMHATGTFYRTFTLVRPCPANARCPIP